MSLYRIAFAADSQAHSIVRELAVQPVPGDELTLDADTIVAVREVITHPESDTIRAEIIAETVAGAAIGTTLRPTGSGSHS